VGGIGSVQALILRLSRSFRTARSLSWAGWGCRGAAGEIPNVGSRLSHPKKM
jgi:hypothetical protein